MEHKEVKYISPSSYMEWKMCPHKFWLKRLSGLPIPRQPQSDAAALGTIFDCAVKSAITTDLNSDINRKDLWESVDVRPTQLHLVDEGIDLFNVYRKANVTKDITCVDLKCEVMHNGVPIFGYPDARTGESPFDWKTSGYGSQYSVSPKPGYHTRINLDTGKDMGSHKRAGEPLDHLDKPWGIQCLFYSWMLGIEKPCGTIHQLIYTKKGRQLAMYHGLISEDLMHEVELDLALLWDQCGSRQMADAQPNNYICNKYGQLCEAAVHCKEFQTWLESQP